MESSPQLSRHASGSLQEGAQTLPYHLVRALVGMQNMEIQTHDGDNVSQDNRIVN